MLWLLRVVELAPISVGAVEFLIEVVAFFGSVVRVNVLLLE